MKKIAIISLVLLSACATTVEDSKQTINFTTSDGKPANCQLVGKEYENQATIPAQVKVKRSYYPLNVTCDSKGKKSSVKVLSDVSNWGYGGAVLGIGVGAGVDAATGSAYEYPAEVLVTVGASTKVGETALNSNADSNK